MFRRVLAVIVLAAAVLAAGCGGGDDESSGTAEWADGVCSALTDWTGSLQSAGEALQGGGEGLSQEGVETAVADVKAATDTLVDDLRELGAPDTESGEEAKEKFDALADDLESEVEEIEGALDDASDGGGVLTAVSTVSSALVEMANQVATALSGLEDLDAGGELEDAFRDADACDALTESSGQ